jgi:hypothetical protein
MYHDGFMGGMGYNWIYFIVIIVLIVFILMRFTNQNKKK